MGSHMKKSLRAAAILLAVCLIAVIPQTGFAVPERVNIVLNGEILDFEGVQPYFEPSANRVYVPVYALCEALGAGISASSSGEITVSYGGVTASCTPGSTAAVINGEPVTLDAAPLTREDGIVVPVRFLADALRLSVGWNSTTLTVSLISPLALQLGLSADRAKAMYGDPTRNAVSEKGYRWWVYDDLKNYRMLGIEDEQVVAYYLHSSAWDDASGLSAQMTADECSSVLRGYAAHNNGSYIVYTGSRDVFTLFFNAEGKCYALLHELASYVETTRISAAVLESYALQMLDLVNIERISRGLPVLVWDASIADVAGLHASDMAKNNIYSHEGTDGSSPSDRLTDAGFDSFYELETIARAYPNALIAFSAHLSSPQYVAALEAGYSSMGAGSAYNPDSDGLLYYTQVFYTAK